MIVWDVMDMTISKPPLEAPPKSGEITALGFLNNSCLFVTGHENGSVRLWNIELEKIIKSLIPDATINFDESGKPTPFIDCQDDTRIRKELSFIPRTLKQGIKEHMNEARLDHGLELLN